MKAKYFALGVFACAVSVLCGAAYHAEVAKIDSLATDGLLGTNNSLAYRVHEIEKHFHSNETWGQLDSNPDGTDQVADFNDIDNPYVSTTGNSAYGSWIQVLGPDDIPARGSNVKFDLHRIVIENVSADANKQIHKIQISVGASGDAGVSAGDWTEVIDVPEKDGKSGPIEVQMGRASDGDSVWLRHKVDGQDAETMNFFIGLHEYAG
jgi:hypothetical protein